MRRLAAALLCLGTGCSGFVPPTPEDFRRLDLPSGAPQPELRRYRVHLDVDSAWLAGEFEGVVIARGGPAPEARVQLLGDVGPKVVDLLARPDRIVGFFPQTREAVDCLLPSEAALHPLLFLGASVLEEVADLRQDRIVGIRPDPEGWWLRLRPVVPGMRSEALRTPDGRTVERRLGWMYGISWRERWESPDECTIRAPGLVLRVRVQSSEPLRSLPGRAFELSLPRDARIAVGSRK